jgi:transcriptional regulator with XRE-family HTH domain
MNTTMRRVPPPELGPLLRERRLAAGLGLRECARRVGIAPGYLGDLESSRSCPSAAVAAALAAVLGLDEAARGLLDSAAVPEVGYAKPGRVRVLTPGGPGRAGR